MRSQEIKTEEELAGMLALLKRSHLPFEDIALNGNLFIGYYDSMNKLIGVAGLESYGEASLLRSVAVTEDQRGKSIGTQIIKDILNQASQRKIKEVYLLTETAHDFFLSRGFKDISRDLVPPQVKASSEFSSVCPVSAACMVYTLKK